MLSSIVKESGSETGNINVSYFCYCGDFSENFDIEVCAKANINTSSSRRTEESLIVARFTVEKDYIKSEQIKALMRLAHNAKEKISVLQEKNKETLVKIDKDKVFGLIDKIVDIFSEISNIKASMTLGYFVANKYLLSKILKLDIASIGTLDLKEKNIFFSADKINVAVDENFYSCLDMIAKRFFVGDDDNDINVTEFYVSDVALISLALNPDIFNGGIPVKGNKDSKIVFQEDFFHKLSALNNEQVNRVCSFIESLDSCWCVKEGGSYHTGACRVFCKFLFDDYAKSEAVLKIFNAFSQKNILEIYFMQKDDFVVGKENFDEAMENFSCIKKILENNKVINDLKIRFICSSNEDMTFQKERSKKFIEIFYLDLMKYIFSRNTSLDEFLRLSIDKKPLYTSECDKFLKRNRNFTRALESFNCGFRIISSTGRKGIFWGISRDQCLKKVHKWEIKAEDKIKMDEGFSIEEYFEGLERQGFLLSSKIEKILKDRKDKKGRNDKNDEEELKMPPLEGFACLEENDNEEEGEMEENEERKKKKKQKRRLSFGKK